MAVEALSASTPSPAPGAAPSARAADGEGRHAARWAFEAALQRAAPPRAWRGRDGAGDALGAERPGSKNELTNVVPLPVPALAPPPLQPAPEAARWAPQPLPVASAAAQRLQLVQALPVAAAGPAGRWQLQLLDRTLPVGRLDIQRDPAGALHLALQVATSAASGVAAQLASPATLPPVLRSVQAGHAAQAAPTEKLRQRLAARGAPAASITVHSSTEDEER